jgi:hypothetical protein
MTTHYHVVLETTVAYLSAGMQWLNGLYAQYFNRRHGRSGHLFQGRFGAKVMRSDAQLLLAARYIARNPVKSGLCREAAGYPWSSHAATLNGVRPRWLDTPLLLGYFGADGSDPLGTYTEFVA